MAVQAPAAPPAPVRTSFNLWMINIALSIVSLVLLLVGGGELMTASLGAPVDPAFQEAATVGMYVGLALVLALVVVELLCVLKMRAGRNWARIVLTVIGVLAILIGLTGINETIGMVSSGGLLSAVGIISLLGYPLLVAAMVFMYLPAARDYFAARPPAR